MKADEGPVDWLNFFSLSSQYIAHRDGIATANDLSVEELKRELSNTNSQGHFLERLQAFRVVQSHIVKRAKDSRYFIIMLNLKKKVLNFRGYRTSSTAEDVYKKLELDNKENADVDVVLVKGGGATEIKKAYPNYFADTADFVKEIQSALH
jgi:hypothetical protein